MTVLEVVTFAFCGVWIVIALLGLWSIVAWVSGRGGTDSTRRL
jgi:hypothetical protein